MNKNEARTTKLMEMLQINRELDVRTVAESLEISEATVRRLFSQLEKEGRVIRTHGGVRLAPHLGYDYSYRLSIVHRQREKTVIGNVAAEFVEDNDHIFLDSGTTVLKMAEALAVRMKLGKVHNVVVLTNSLSHIETVARLCKVILLGGEIRVERRDVCGTISEKNLFMYHVDKAFIGTDSISIDGNLMTTDERTARLNELVVERSDRVFVLADSEKFNKKSFITYARLKDIDTLITDNGITDHVETLIQKSGINLIVVPTDSNNISNTNSSDLEKSE